MPQLQVEKEKGLLVAAKRQAAEAAEAARQAELALRGQAVSQQWADLLCAPLAFFNREKAAQPGARRACAPRHPAQHALPLPSMDACSLVAP